MAELPFLLFPRPSITGRTRPPGRSPSYQKPTPGQQRDRLQTKFDQIAESFNGLQETVSGIDPEQVIVLETLTEAVENGARAASQIPGLEWLGERELDEVPPDFGFKDVTRPQAKLPARLYALMSNQRGIEQLLGLWREWALNPTQRAKARFGPFKKLFELLRDVRRWSPQDRIDETGILERWTEDVAVGADILFEVEFWFRLSPTQREQAYAEVDSLVRELEGRCLDQSVIPEILYHATLVQLPARVVQQFIEEIRTNTYSKLLRSQGVMFVRPRAQSVFPLLPAQATNLELDQRLVQEPIGSGPPVVAVLDGVPLENHAALAGRIIVDDPDGHAPIYKPNQQLHGTAMASLVLHGDLNGSGPSLRAKIYIRPIFHPDSFNRREITPPNRLLVDLVHTAIRRLFEDDGQEAAVAPTIRVVNLSLGNPEEPFDRELSALARLLDWLSWKYKILIIVSIGNRIVPMALGANLDALSDDEYVARVLQSMQRSQIVRRPLSPAEAINCISVGAVHADACPTYTSGNREDLLRGRRLPSPINTIASGFRRSTKPEILLPGGRQLYRKELKDSGAGVFVASESLSPPGIMVAAPGISGMELNRVGFNCGTSNSAALASRCAALTYERLSAISVPPDSEPLNPTYHTLLLKALLVHGASWGTAATMIENAFPDTRDQWQKIAQLKQQFLGYGEVDLGRCLGGSEQRATLLGWATISDGQGHIFELPLPPGLAASTEMRRLTVTLAWLTPTNQRHKDYRKAQLWIEVPEEQIGTRRDGLDAPSSRRGTLEHRTFLGQNAIPFIDGSKLKVLVNCKEDAGRLNEEIPYAIAVTLEVGADVQIDIYQQISSRIRQVIGIRAV